MKTLDNLDKDPFILILLELPSASIFNLCSSSSKFKNRCDKWQDDLYSNLIRRDGGSIYQSKSIKDSYITNFLILGQPYYLKIIRDGDGLTLSNIAEIKNRSLVKDISQNYARFYLGGKNNPEIKYIDF